MLTTLLVASPIASTPASAVMTTDGLVAYSIGSFHEVHTNSYTNSTNTMGAVSQASASGLYNSNFIVRTSPIKHEALLGYADSNGHFYLACFNGTSWSDELYTTIGTDGTRAKFDIAYETTTGDAMVTFSNESASTWSYITKPGSQPCGAGNWALSKVVVPTTTTGIVQWMKLAADRRDGSNLLTVVWSDVNNDLSSMQWTGSSWTNEPASALETSLAYASAAGDVDNFDVQYESTSGDVMVVWDNSAGGAGTNGVRYATCTGGVAACTWSAATTPPTFTDDATNLTLSANPNNDEMVFASIGKSRGYLQAGYWSGSSWTNTAALDTSSETPAAGTHMVSSAWLTAGGTTRSVIVYHDAGATNIGWVTGNGSSFNIESDASPSPAFSSTQSWYELYADPLMPDRLMFITTDSSSDLFAKRLVMTSTPNFTWTDSNGGAAIETSVSQPTSRGAGFAYWSAPPLDQSNFRWYANANAVQPTTALAAENATARLTASPGPVRLRQSLNLPMRKLLNGKQSYSLQYATSTSGPWAPVAANGWWNASWQNRRKVTFDNSASLSDLGNFPVLVTLSAANIDYTKTQNSGQDIRFVDSSGNALSYEIEKWDESGTSSVWVKVPEIAARSTTDYIWMYYNNAGASDAQSATAVYDSSTKMVHHLEETASCSTYPWFYDSTSNANDASCRNPTGPTSATGQIGDARYINSLPSLDVASNAGLSPTKQVTVSAWVNQDSSVANRAIVSKWTYVNGSHGPWTLQTGSNGTTLRVFVADSLNDTGSNYADTPVGSFSPGWHHVAFTFDGDRPTAERLTVYIDGTPQRLNTGGSMPATLTSTSSVVSIGDFINLNRPWNGKVDEVSISNSARSTDWIRAQYLNQADSFANYGAEQGQGGVDAQWSFYNNATPSDGATVGTRLLSNTTVSENYVESGSSSTTPNTLDAGDVGEWDFSLDGTNATDNVTYYFRVVTDQNIPINSYSNYPSITFVTSLDQSAYRWYANADAVQPGVALAGENQAATVANTSSAMRLRAQLGVTGNDFTARTGSFGLQYSTSTAGPWNDVAGAWWNSSWLNRRKILFNNTASTTDSDNITLLVSVDSSTIDYSKTQNSGQDIRFTDGDSTPLSYEIEKWDETGTSTIWVKVPRLDAASPYDHIWMYYNNTGASDGQAPSSTFDANTKMVLHLNEPAACLTTFNDSTSNANNGSCYSSPVPTPGHTSGGRYFDGIDDTVNVTSSASLSPTSAITASAWVKQDVIAWDQAIMAKWYYAGGIGGTEGPWGLQTAGDGTSLRVFIGTTPNDVGNNYADTAPGTWSLGWHQVAFTYDASASSNAKRLKIYIDGQQMPLTFWGTIPSALVTNSNDVAIGAFPGLTRNWHGYIDQVEISNVARSADWMRANYMAQAGTLNTFGSEESESSLTWAYRPNATPAHGALISSLLLTGSDVLESYQEQFPSVLNPNEVAAGQQGEWDFSLAPSGASMNTTYYFRVTRVDGSVLDSYTVYPAVNVGPTLQQGAYRLYANANSADVGAPLAAQDTAATTPAQGTPFRMRALVHTTGHTYDVGTPSMKLQYAARSGTCDTSFTGETYADVATGSGAIRYYNNGAPADGAVLTTNINDPTLGNTVVPQTYEEANNTTTVTQIPIGQDGQWDFSLVDFSAPAGTTYCFRVVRADGLPLDSYGVVPQVTTVANLAPSAPTSLAQYKSNGSTAISAVWTNETTVVFKATVADQDASDTDQLCVEAKPIATPFDNTETCGTGVAYSGSGVTATSTISGLSNGTSYHWQARVKDAGGAVSSWVSFGANLETAADFGVDTTAPSTASAYNGLSAPIQENANNGSLSSLSGSWSAFTDATSGIASYDYSLGTSAGATDILTWTNTTDTTTKSFTASSLTLHTSQLYYVNVRANDTAGNQSAVSSSAGQVVAPTLTFSISSPLLNFGTLHAGNSFTSSQSLTLTTSTNAYGGYSIRQYQSLPFSGGGTTMPAFNGGSYAAPDSWQSGDTGFGYTSSDTNVGGSNIFQPATCLGGSSLAAPGCFAPFASSTSGDVVADHPASVTGTSISNETFTLTYRVTAPNTLPAASYSTQVVFTAIPTY